MDYRHIRSSQLVAFHIPEHGMESSRCWALLPHSELLKGSFGTDGTVYLCFRHVLQPGRGPGAVHVFGRGFPSKPSRSWNGSGGCYELVLGSYFGHYGVENAARVWDSCELINAYIVYTNAD